MYRLVPVPGSDFRFAQLAQWVSKTPSESAAWCVAGLLAVIFAAQAVDPGGAAEVATPVAAGAGGSGGAGSPLSARIDAN